MRYLVGDTSLNGEILWNHTKSQSLHKDDGLTIDFRLSGRFYRHNLEMFIRNALEENRIDWLCFSGGRWFFDGEKLKHQFEKNYADLGWIRGYFQIYPDIVYNVEILFGKSWDQTYFRIVLTPEIIEESVPKSVFLSHKGIDKPTVRRFKAVLQAVGIQTWLDEDALHAGADLERGILKGFENSCAAVFFVTPNFKDEDYLASEVTHAIRQKTDKGEKFSIITLSLPDSEGCRGTIPELLRSYVWKSPDDELSAYAEIIKALPISIGFLSWK